MQTALAKFLIIVSSNKSRGAWPLEYIPSILIKIVTYLIHECRSSDLKCLIQVADDGVDVSKFERRIEGKVIHFL